ncbi:YcgL domain-containing protein [Conservatibacter flavescens]|uniref:YcgL domain-containing protein CVP05_00705 n=1 Tax=Conservatibacter flavescens TaxID=28161 RepID=A0A2M8S5D3_9PAST|nr:YcgL domain-containing protein [Conservatibacter flavescens]PJG86365.1 hypothetical protein CVP05_00705 [Conservatibacter flavescens]
MLCAIYKSNKKAGMYLYIAKREQFDCVPHELMEAFGRPKFVMLFNLLGEKQLAQVDNDVVLDHIRQHGFYLQMSKENDELFGRIKQI